jgi:hypothetical protein
LLNKERSHLQLGQARFGHGLGCGRTFLFIGNYIWVWGSNENGQFGIDPEKQNKISFPLFHFLLKLFLFLVVFVLHLQ